MDASEYKIFIEDLKNRYNKKETSALIGAGFSKNIYGQFPDWNELLYQMICELFKPEIDTAYSVYCHQTGRRAKDEKEVFSKRYAKQLSATHGYLNIVSMYVQRYGFRECVELYIEKHIPYLDINNKELIFFDKTKKPITDSDLEVHKKLLQLIFLNHIFTTNYDNLIEELSDQSSGKWGVISSAYELKLSDDKKPIIKIHGDIRRNKTDEFCFDGDHRLRYIIAKEDYDNYPKDHEAFMQLMRISLLRESFVLFGFSGQDPNFIAWIKWVRDILLKDEKREKDITKPEYYKIFLFAVDENEPKAEDAQFYINHRIKYIPILHPDFLSFLCIDPSNLSEEDLIKQTLMGIFDYLYQGKDYAKLWNDVVTNVPKEDVIKQIQILKKDNRLVKCVFQQEQSFSTLKNIKLSESAAKLLVFALQDTKHPVNYYRPLKLAERIVENLKDKEIKHQFDLLNQRFEVLQSDGSVTDFELTNEDFEADYNNILCYAFAFDFTKLRTAVEAWNPSGHWLQNKAILTAYFNIAKARSILLDYLTTEVNPKERFYATTLLNVVSESFNDRYSTADYENQGLDSLWDFRDTIIQSIKKEKTDIKPYGWNGVTRSFGFENVKYLSAVRFIQFLLDSGLPVHTPSFSCVDKADWYLVAKELFEQYPYPILWFSLHLTDSDTLKRIGQDYAYSENLKISPTTILKKLFVAYFNENTSGFIKEAILAFVPSLFVRVPVRYWTKDFEKIWSEQYLPKIDFGYSMFHLRPFIQAGLPYITSNSLKCKIIEDCITELLPKNCDEAINVTYYLDTTLKQSKSLKQLIDNLIYRIDSSDQIIFLGNIYRLLKTTQVKQVGDKIIEIDGSGKPFSYKAVPVLAYFAKESSQTSEAISCVKRIIVNHKNLWNTGIVQREGEIGASDPKFIEVDRLNYWIEWTPEDKVEIFNKLVENFTKLSATSYIKNDESFITYAPILTEMFRFLMHNKTDLESQQNYSEIYEQVKKELVGRRQFDDVETGLWSSDRIAVIRAINELDSTLNIDDINKYVSYIDIILDRIVLQKPEALSSCLDMLSYYIGKYPTVLLEDAKMKKKLSVILSTYQNVDFKSLNLDLSKVCKYLVAIAEAFSANGVNESEVQYWLSMKKRFTYTKFDK